MKKTLFAWIILCFLFASCHEVSKDKTTNLRLWYEQPAIDWGEALPIGNGRLGAMIYGGIGCEELQLNEETFWTGFPNSNVNKGAKEHIAEIRRLQVEGKYKEAEALASDVLVSKATHGQSYITMGSLFLNFPNTAASNYYRELDISKAISRVKYSIDGVEYSRESFSSFTDNLIVTKLSASKKGAITFDAALKTPLDDYRVEIKDGMIVLNERADRFRELYNKSNTGPASKVLGCVMVKIEAKGGAVTTESENIKVADADEVLIYISMGTNFKNFRDISGNAEETARQYMASTGSKPYKKMITDHTIAYKKYFDRMSIDLGTDIQTSKPTDIRLKEFTGDNDPQLATLYLQYGRYMLICSSQPGGQPANLQGIWSKDIYPPWSSKFTTNINLEMNYWPAEITNLPEMHEPLIQIIRDLRGTTGVEAASELYGSRGWVVHHNTDIWRMAAPIDGPWGVFPTANAWLCEHLWNHYLFGGDKDYLKSVYPIMKETCEFFFDNLVEYQRNGWLVVAPSNSPENSPTFGPANKINLHIGTTMDTQILEELFFNTLQAAKVLDIEDTAFLNEVKKTADRLPPMQIGRLGQLQEWIEDWDNPDHKHRHISHLYGLYPSNQISVYRTPELTAAVRNALNQRGDMHASWGMAWRIGCWARLHDAERALKLLTYNLQPALLPGGHFTVGTFPNLWSSAPPYQLDGVYGGAACISEMILQSHDGAIDLLPALPKLWANGSMQGMRTVGGFEIEDMQWKDGKLTEVTIKSNLGGNCRLRMDGIAKTDDGMSLAVAEGTNPNPFFATPEAKKPIISPKTKLELGDVPAIQVYDLPTEAGKTYKLKVEAAN
ncbi:MAG: glycoside hydrolase family 95 protein [Mediterranea sp.]|jgi:alpha-L-fucosidase 2|nr:glycoside hydrolase family 95 protein [Mediterranea sp.]